MKVITFYKNMLGFINTTVVRKINVIKMIGNGYAVFIKMYLRMFRLHFLSNLFLSYVFVVFPRVIMASLAKAIFYKASKNFTVKVFNLSKAR